MRYTGKCPPERKEELKPIEIRTRKLVIWKTTMHTESVTDYIRIGNGRGEVVWSKMVKTELDIT